jgi:hypothetical protein
VTAAATVDTATVDTAVLLEKDVAHDSEAVKMLDVDTAGAPAVVEGDGFPCFEGCASKHLTHSEQACGLTDAQGIPTADVSGPQTSCDGMAPDTSRAPRGPRSHAPARRNSSLKTLLAIEQYAFVRDVDVSAAWQVVGGNEAITTATAPEDKIMAMSKAASPEGVGNNAGSDMPLPHTVAVHNETPWLEDTDVACTASHLMQGKRKGSRIARRDSVVLPQESEAHAAALNSLMEGAKDKLSSDLRNLKLPASFSAASRPDSNVLAVGPALPQTMKRWMWSVDDYSLSRCLHQGYASHVSNNTFLIMMIYTKSDMDGRIFMVTESCLPELLPCQASRTTILATLFSRPQVYSATCRTSRKRVVLKVSQSERELVTENVIPRIVAHRCIMEASKRIVQTTEAPDSPGHRSNHRAA